MPMFTISVKGKLVNPFFSPEMMLSEKVLILFFTAAISGMQFSVVLNAVCKTALPSVSLIFLKEI